MKRAGGPGRTPVYPFPTMEVGQAFFYPDHAARSRMRSLACYWQRKHPGKKWSVKVHERDGVKGWRVERWA